MKKVYSEKLKVEHNWNNIESSIFFANIFFEDTLRRKDYFCLLEEHNSCSITEFLENNNEPDENLVIFQQNLPQFDQQVLGLI